MPQEHFIFVESDVSQAWQWNLLCFYTAYSFDKENFHITLLKFCSEKHGLKVFRLFTKFHNTFKLPRNFTFSA